jgi:hypothetical protein
MTDLRDEIKRAVEMTDAELNNLVAKAITVIRAVVLEEAAKVAEAKGDEWATVWRNRLWSDSNVHMEGQSDGAHEIAAAIRNLIPKEAQDADKA